MRDISLDALTFDHLRAMKDNSVAEGRHLDYKLELPGVRDDDKKEFLADICSFANAGGGDLVFGIEEAKDETGKNAGTIAQLRGLPGFNVDETQRRLEAIIRDGLDPRLPSLRFRTIDGGSDGPFLVVRVGRSFVTPHMVKFQNLSRFYSRNGQSKFQLDVREIRAAFLEADQGLQRARSFRLDRIARILADDTPVRTGNGPRWALHVVPVRHAWNADVALVSDAQMQRGFRPMRANSWSLRHNLDGLVSVSGSKDARESHTYSILFRDGAVEGVDAGLLEWNGEERVIPSVAIEEYVQKYADLYVRLLRRLGVDAPLAIGLSFLNALDFKMGVSSDTMWFRDKPLGFDRRELLMPEVIVETDSVNYSQLRGAFDVMWQAAGWPGSLNFGEDGAWMPQR